MVNKLNQTWSYSRCMWLYSHHSTPDPKAMPQFRVEGMVMNLLKDMTIEIYRNKDFLLDDPDDRMRLICDICSKWLNPRKPV